MKRIAAPFFVMAIIFPVIAADELERALRLIAQSTKESCGVCVETLKKKGFNQLNAFFYPGREFRGEALIKIADSGSAEFVTGSYPESGKWEFEGEEVLLPLVTYRIHTAADTFPGIAKDDFTSDQMLKKFNSAGKGSPIKGVFRIIAYPYGDGKSFIYSERKNRIQVQVKILSIE
jgi:hypothetical protein